MVSAVAVPSEENRSGTTTKSVEAGVTHESVSRVPPTTPMERLSFWGLAVLPRGARGSSVTVVGLVRSVSDMGKRFRSTRAADVSDTRTGSAIASEGLSRWGVVRPLPARHCTVRNPERQRPFSCGFRTGRLIQLRSLPRRFAAASAFHQASRINDLAFPGEQAMSTGTPDTSPTYGNRSPRSEVRLNSSALRTLPRCPGHTQRCPGRAVRRPGHLVLPGPQWLRGKPRSTPAGASDGSGQRVVTTLPRV